MTGAPPNIESLLCRLERVRRSGRGWIAQCPAHEDRIASLSIASGDDGRALLHCFAGCGAGDVVAAMGLSLADLFERRPTANMSPSQRAELRQRRRESGWSAALRVLAMEAHIVAIAAGDITRAGWMGAEDHARIVLASERIQYAREVLA